tara:strand:+ start:60 stop:1025 length:966 start_codon:yes stop_codon:yes gene_type:complete
MKHLLFATDKWCDGKPLLSFTNAFHNAFNSFSRSIDDWTFNTLHLDEAGIVYKKDINNVLVDYCKEHSPSLVVFSLLNGATFNPSITTYKKLRELGVKTCIFWPDTGPTWGMQTIAEIADSVDLHVSWDCPTSWHEAFKPSRPREPNHIDLWTPEDESLFYPTDKKHIDVSFLGSVDKYRDRTSLLPLLKSEFPDIVMSGGQRTSKLTPSKYAAIVRDSKIGINFPMSQTGVFCQAKGRIFEYTSCNSLLIDWDNPSTKRFFDPEKEYISVKSHEELVEKIKFYLSNEKERAEIAWNGFKKFRENWTAEIFWKTLLKKLNL